MSNKQQIYKGALHWAKIAFKLNWVNKKQWYDEQELASSIAVYINEPQLFAGKEEFEEINTDLLFDDSLSNEIKKLARNQEKIIKDLTNK